MASGRRLTLDEALQRVRAIGLNDLTGLPPKEHARLRQIRARALRKIPKVVMLEVVAYVPDRPRPPTAPRPRSVTCRRGHDAWVVRADGYRHCRICHRAACARGELRRRAASAQLQGGG